MSLKKRFGQLAAATVALVVAGGWWVAIVELWPASSRPYIGGSQNNSFLELTFGYNGLGRLSGDETGSVGGGGGGGGTGQWGETGWDRMFNSEIGGQISWLLPAALILLVAGLVATRKLKRTSVTRGSFLVWGGSLLITAGRLQLHGRHLPPVLHDRPRPLHRRRGRHGRGHPVGEARARCGRRSPSRPRSWRPRAWGYVLLNRTPDYLPWLKWLVLVGGLAAALGLIFVARIGRQLALGAAAA